ncbi:RHS repeat-associated core domain-containing protein [Streptomyces sp. NPDC005303]|uniref:RHS repeat-associated core domain-containing protein n=1 Tax=Streptomyces sp. NPDC005303 TaxID=3155713 RepID=UPI0033BCAAFF
MAPVASRPDAVAAMMAAKSQHSPVEVLDDRNDASQTFADPNGTFTYKVSAQPRWVKRGSEWAALDAQLERTKSGTVVPLRSESPLVLSGGGRGPLAIMTVDGRKLSLSWPSALPRPVLSGDTATYANVLPHGVDLRVTVTAAGGIEETLVVKNAQAAADPQLAALALNTVNGSGTSLSQDAGGNVKMTDKHGRELVTSPAPVMWDSATDAPATAPSAGSGASRRSEHPEADTVSTTKVPGSRAHTGRVKSALKGRRLTFSPDLSMLKESSTAYPVYIDPAFTPHPASGSTLHYDEVQQAYPTVSNYDTGGSGGLAVGYQGFSSPTGIERTFYNLSVPSAIYGAHVISATLNSKVVYAAASGSNSTTANVFSMGSISSSTTWNNQPAKATGSTNPNYPSPNVSKAFTTTSSSPNLSVAFDLTAGMQTIANIHNSNWTLGLYNASETNDIDLVRFTDNPTFSITYNNPPSTPSNLSMTPSDVSGSTSYTSTSTPTLSSSATDANSDTVQLDYQILSGSTVKASGNTAFVTSGTAATWKPSTALPDGSYTWQVRAYDGEDYSAWTTAKAFTIDTATPPAPSVSCTGYPSGQWTAAISGGTTCSLTDSSSDITGYDWSLDSGTTTYISGTAPSISINPAAGYHTLSVYVVSKANKNGTTTNYSFGVGSAGMTSPDDQGTTSTTFPLQAAAPPGSAQVTFKYRKGTTGSFITIPAGDVTNSGSPVTWPVATASATGEVQSPALTWNVAHTLNDDGLLQIEAVFTDSSGNSPITTPPVNDTLDRIGTGADFGTTKVGPVTIGLQSGNASVSANDVSIASFGSGLGVTRTFNSLAPTASSIFGFGWTTSLPVEGTSAMWSSVTEATSYATLTGTDGSKLTFATGGTDGTGLTTYAPQGPAVTAGLTLTKKSGAFTLTDINGIVTAFSVPQGGATGVYLPTSVTQPGGGNTSTGYVYDSTAGDPGYGKPLLVIAADANAAAGTPSTTACPNPPSAATWDAGCRALKFSYDATTGNVSEIDFVTSNGSTLTQTPVADYTYDAAGRLKYEWDPRISTPLKTMYSYDETDTDSDYGRITAIYPAQNRGLPANVLQPWTLAYDFTPSDANFGKLVSVTHTHNAANGSGVAKSVVVYSVPLTTAAGGPTNMDSATTATWGQQDSPVSAVAIFPADHAPSSSPPSDWTYAQVLYYDADGREVNEASYTNGWNISTTEYDSNGNDVRELTAGNRATALAASGSSATVAGQLDTENLYSADGTELLDSYGPAHQAVAAGSLQTIRTHTHDVYDVGAPNNDQDANGNAYDLVTSETVSASLGTSVPGSSDVDGRTTQNVYNIGSDNTGWTLRTPLQTTNDPGTGHLDITNAAAYNEDSSLYGGESLPIETRMPSNTAGGGAGTTKAIYYTAGANSADSGCGNEAAWADLACKTKPAAQPGTSGLASLPVTRYTYNVYLEPLTRTETYTAADGSTSTRTTTTTYDSAGRSVGTSITTSGSGMGIAVPATKTVYDSDTGLPKDTQNVASDGTVTADLNTTYDDFGNTASYTDASGNVATYTYDLANRIIGRADGKGSATLTYNGGGDHSGDMTSETDSLAGTFTTTYTADGDIATQNYPGGTVGTYTYDPTETATNLTYNNAAWAEPISDSIDTNTHGDWAQRNELNGSKSYTYDAADRLVSVADAQAGQCTTRTYGYDVDSNRTSTATAAPASDGSCQTATATTRALPYDAADRLTDTGYTYDTQGDITTTPAVDAGGTNALSATYFANHMIASQTQNSATMSWQYDPQDNRVATYIDSSGITHTNHYADGSDNPVWTNDSSGGWTRNISTPAGLVAQVTSTGTVLALVDLHRDTVATVDPASGSVTGTFAYTEFGASESGGSTEYGWKGADQRSSNALGQQILMGVRAYNPDTGRFSQVDSVVGGSANSYDYSNQNPVTGYDLTGTRGNSNAQWCSVSGRWKTCRAYVSEWRTHVIIDLLYAGAAVFGALAIVCGWFCASIGAGLGLLAPTIQVIDDWGGDRGIYFQVWFYRVSWWWWGWHHRWVYSGGYTWHQ